MNLSPLQKLDSPLLSAKKIDLYIKRDDLLHPLVSGNKWRKLKHNIAAMQDQGLQKMLTFGGAFSNHIYATAAAGQLLGFETIGIIRGESYDVLNPTLAFAKSCGMHLIYLDRSHYQTKNLAPIIKANPTLLDNCYMVPEGGSNQLAVDGCKNIVREIEIDFDYITVPCGTGTTLAGIVNELKPHQKAIGFSALKAEDYFEKEIAKWVDEKRLNHVSINYNYHFGGYAKITKTLLDFTSNFEIEFGVKLDPIYTGKMMYGLFELIEQNHFEPNTNIVSVHTGGLQGWMGMQDKINKLYNATKSE